MGAFEKGTIEEGLTKKKTLFLRSGEIMEEDSALEDCDSP